MSLILWKLKLHLNEKYRMILKNIECKLNWIELNSTQFEFDLRILNIKILIEILLFL